MIDTLAISNKMKQAGFTPQQAEAQAALFADLVDSDLTTKRDLKELEVALRRDLQDVQASLARDIKAVDLKITQVEANLQRDIKEFELNFGKNLAESPRQMLLGGLGIAGVIIASLGFLIRFSGHA